MNVKRAVYASTLAAGVGLAGLFGTGLGTAAADIGPQCDAPNRPACWQDQHDDQWHHDDNGPQGGPVDWHGRGVDQGRQDHQPFNWNGQEVTPIPAGNGAGWGFWFGPIWIPL